MKNGETRQQPLNSDVGANKDYDDSLNTNAVLIEDDQSRRLTIVPSKKSNGVNGRPDEGKEVVAEGHHTPPDGGCRAWLVAIGSFLINGILFGIINNYSIIFTELQKVFNEMGDSSASAKAASVGSLAIGTTFLLSPVVGVLSDTLGIRWTTFCGGMIAALGMFISSLVTHDAILLYLSYGVTYGVGASLAYTPSLAILGHYFKRNLGLVNGMVTAGSSVFSCLMPLLLKELLNSIGLKGTLTFVGCLNLVIVMCTPLLKPIIPCADQKKNMKQKTFLSQLKAAVDLSIWRKKKYAVWATAVPIALFGYFVSYVHIYQFVKMRFKGSSDTLPLMCIGISSGVGRLVFGYVADFPRVNRIYLQQISFLGIGILTMLLTATTNFGVFLAICLGMGVFDGCFVSLLGPIAFDLCGPRGATQAIGCLLGICSIPLTIGPIIAGVIFDQSGSYTMPFFLAGVPPLIGSVAMFFMKCVSDDDENKEKKSEFLKNDLKELNVKEKGDPVA